MCIRDSYYTTGDLSEVPVDSADIVQTAGFDSLNQARIQINRLNTGSQNIITICGSIDQIQFFVDAEL